MITLKAEKRSISIKVKRLGREGFVTGNISGREIPESIPVKMKRTAAERLLKTCNRGSQILLNVDRRVFNVLIKDICFNSVKGPAKEIDLQVLVSGEKVHSVAEIIPLDHGKVISGVLQQWIQKTSYKALPDTITDKVKVDAGDIKVDDIIWTGDLDIVKNKNTEFVANLDTTVATAIAVHVAAEMTDETAPETKQTGNVL